jgi:23S rRNA (adenine2503-C2)-methyltransferase
MTARQGFQGNLTCGEILNQFRSIPEHASLSNIVYMGMGEPLDNLPEVLKSLEIITSPWGYGWSPSRITVSTIGITDQIQEYLNATRCNWQDLQP